VSRFGGDGACVATFGGANDERIQFSRPQSLHVDRADGTLWIADARNHRIVHVDAAGGVLGMFGRGGTAVGEIRFPYGVDQLSDGTLVVAEYGNNRVQRFTSTGQTLGTWGRAGRKPGELAYPWAVGVDARGGDRRFRGGVSQRAIAQAAGGVVAQVKW
jgi:DNA-binding beta-propeller fold protein YncE